MLKLKFGCIADDFTGASDAASFIKKSGMKTVLVTGLPSENITLPDSTECVVIALKIRTIESREAVRLALAAYAWLKEQGAEHIYYKYCSTFDSTDKGNIGPVIDAVLDKYKLQQTILCPALPVNGRTVKDGILYVNGVPLNETHMRYHPLTPMLSAYIPELMAKQGKYSCQLLASDKLEACPAVNEKVYFVPDYYEDEAAEKIARCFAGLEFLTGGSGILTALAALYRQGSEVALEQVEKVTSNSARALILAGSCSEATLGQIRCFLASSTNAIKINPLDLFTSEADDRNIEDRLVASVVENTTMPILIYSSANPEDVKAVQAHYGSDKVSAKLEGLMATLAVKAVEAGYDKIIVAGGETSGAVTEALKVASYEIGPEIAPGVPIMLPLGKNGLQLALKSGNFGQENFFNEAVMLMQGE